MKKGWMYMLECGDGSYYTGSTINLEIRLAQHQAGEGAIHTKKRLPVKLVYFEEFERIDEAFYREKQIQGWSRKKKEALINGEFNKLSMLSKNYTQYPPTVVSTGSTTEDMVTEPVEVTTATSTGSVAEAPLLPSTGSGNTIVNTTTYLT